MFEKYKDKERKFCGEKIGGDLKGMIELYEASQLRMTGEDILYEAEQFSGKKLKEISACIGVDKAEFVRCTLEQPFHKSLPIFTSRNLFDGSHGMNGWVDALQDVAKLNFNMLQSTYQMEILQISKYVPINTNTHTHNRVSYDATVKLLSHNMSGVWTRKVHLFFKG